MRFLHCADIHLGRQPYGLEERFEDFGRVFRYIGDRAVEENVDAALIAGDLFDKRNINAATLAQAMTGLSRLQAANIPVVAIEGNHDKAFRHDGFSWLEYLSAQGVIILLNPVETDDGVSLPDWDGKTRSGAVLTLENARIVGLGYRGAKTDAFLAQVRDALPTAPDRYTVLMLHSGVGQAEGLIGLGSASKDALFALEDRVDLALLGHWHRKMEWRGDHMRALMPGSPEVCDIQEAGYERGFYVIETPTAPDGEPTVEFEPTPCRPHLRVTADVDGCASSQAIVAKAMEAVASLDDDATLAPVLEVTLAGRLPFDPMDAPIEEIRAAVAATRRALRVEVVNNANLPPPITAGKMSFAGREAVERDAIRSLVGESEEYGAAVEIVSDLALGWKDRAQQTEDADSRDEDVIEMLLEAVGRMDEPASTEPKPTDAA